MPTATWQVAGQYYENCSCDFVCPCILTQLTAKPSQGSCTFAMGFRIDRGRFDALSLDGLGFMVIGFTPEEMGKGNWSAGVIVDERASTAQRDAIVAIASGAAGGPMAALSGMITSFVGVESAPIRFEASGAQWSVNAAIVGQHFRHARDGHRPRRDGTSATHATRAIRRTATSAWPIRCRARSPRSASPGTT